MAQRRYRVWAGSERGTPENPRRCIVEVPDGGQSPLAHQCGRLRGYGPSAAYCAQHAGMLVRGVRLSVPDVHWGAEEA